jgi:hypothetical protein
VLDTDWSQFQPIDNAASAAPSDTGVDWSQFEPAEPGLLSSGNIDLHNRPVVRNADGSISTVRSISINVDGREVLIPTVSDDGRVMSNADAIEQFKRTGRHLGVFDNADDATSYAKRLHEDQASEYGVDWSQFSPISFGDVQSGSISAPQAVDDLGVPNYAGMAASVPDSPIAAPSVADMNANALEQTWLGAKQGALDAASSFSDSIGAGMRAARGIYDAATSPVMGAAAPLLSSAIQAGNDTPEALSSAQGENLDALRNLAELRARQQSREQSLRDGSLLDDVAYYAKQGAGNAAPLVVGAGISAVAPEIAPIVLPAVFGGQSAADTYGERRARGDEPADASEAAAESGVINAALAAVPGHVIATPFKSPLLKTGALALSNEAITAAGAPISMAADQLAGRADYAPEDYASATAEAAKTGVAPSIALGALGARGNSDPVARARRLVDELERTPTEDPVDAGRKAAEQEFDASATPPVRDSGTANTSSKNVDVNDSTAGERIPDSGIENALSPDQVQSAARARAEALSTKDSLTRTERVQLDFLQQNANDPSALAEGLGVHLQEAPAEAPAARVEAKAPEAAPTATTEPEAAPAPAREAAAASEPASDEFVRKWIPSGRKDSKGRDIMEPTIDHSRDGLVQWLGKNGGVDFDQLHSQTGVDPALLKDAEVMRPFGRVGFAALRRKGGMGLERLRERMQEDGWLPRDDAGTPQQSLNDAADLAHEALNGRKVNHPYEGADARLERMAREQDGTPSNDLGLYDVHPHEAERADEAAAHIGERVDAVHGELGRELSDADASDALSISDLATRAVALGADPIDVSFAHGRTQAETAHNLWQLVKEREHADTRGNEEGNRGRAGGSDQANGLADESSEAGQPRYSRKRPGTEDLFGATSEPAREEVAPPRATTADMFGGPSARDALGAAERERDASRNGMRGGRENAGDGGLFDGVRPEQTDLGGPKYSRQRDEAPSADGIESHELTPEEAAAMMRKSGRERTPVVADDNTTAGLTGLAQHDDAFAYGASRENSLPGIFRDIERGYIVAPSADRASEAGADKAWRVTTPAGKEATVYQSGHKVWLDVSRLEKGQEGSRIYNAVANFAHNTKRQLVPDPAGVSKVALKRRTEAMLSSALKFGTTDHLVPHGHQVSGRPDIGLPALNWKPGDTAHNIREMARVTAASTEREYPEIAGIRYNPESDRFETHTGREVKDDDFERIARRAGGVGLGSDGSGEGSSGSSAPTAGRRTLKRAVLVKSLASDEGGKLARLLVARGGRGGESDSGVALPEGLKRVLYSKDERATARRTPEQSAESNAQAESAAAKAWGKGAIARLRNRAGLMFATKQEIADAGIGGHTSVDQLEGVNGFHDPKTGKTVIVSDSVPMDDVAGVVSHEVFHGNAPKFLGSDAFRRLKVAFNRLGKHDSEIAAAQGRVPKDTPEAHRDEEGLAYLAEDAPNHPLAKRLVDEGKLFLNRLGVPLEWLNAHAAAVRKIAALNLRDASENAEPRTTGAGTTYSRQDDLGLRGGGAEDLPQGPVSRVISSFLPGAESIVTELQKAVAPMAAGSAEARAVAKDFANAIRKARFEGVTMDDALKRDFTPEQQERMWKAADEESVLRQQGQDTAGKGLSTLSPDERSAVGMLQANARRIYEQARKLGMVEGEGLPSYTPRMVVRMGETGPRPVSEGQGPRPAIGTNVRTSTGQLKQRKHMTAAETEAAAKAKLGDDVQLVQNIRTLPLATSKLAEAVTGRTLINRIRDIGKETAQDTVREGSAPNDGHTWFTLEHPAFSTWRPRLENVDGKSVAVKDANGNTVFDRVPLYVRGDFEGPLKAVLSQPNGPIYNALMTMKGKAMSVIMYSPLIHNAVEWGRALPAMPGKVATFRIYFEGNQAKNDLPTMREAIDAGLVPIGSRAGFQDITSIQEGDNIIPGRSWTAKLLAAVPGLFDKRAGDAVKRAVDRMGDFWHNTLLWDRVGDLQAGLYVNLRDSLIKKGTDAKTAQRMAAHLANRYAGALPVESMSNAARKIANVVAFSRSFTLGNLGAMKDALTGLPRDVQSQILRDSGSEALAGAKNIARRKAIGIILTDIALSYVGNSLLQSGLAIALGNSDLSKEARAYAERLQAAMQRVKERPTDLLNPGALVTSLTPMSENEPEKQDRVLVGHASDGTAIYMRNPAGKIGEEFMGWLSSPLDMVRRKLGTFVRPALEIVSNDKGFGRKVYDPYADTPTEWIKNAGRIAQLIIGEQLPLQSIQAAKDALSGAGDKKVALLQSLGPFAGLTFSKGAPGGEAVGELYHARDKHQFAVDEALPGIRDAIRADKVDEAYAKMHELGMSTSYQRWIVRTTRNPSLRLSPKQLKEFYNYASQDEIERMQRASGN